MPGQGCKGAEQAMSLSLPGWNSVRVSQYKVQSLKDLLPGNKLRVNFGIGSPLMSLLHKRQRTRLFIGLVATVTNCLHSSQPINRFLYKEPFKLTKREKTHWAAPRRGAKCGANLDQRSASSQSNCRAASHMRCMHNNRANVS